MFGSWSLGRIAGIEIKIHLTFLLIVAVVVFHGISWGGASGAVLSLIQLGVLFGLVVLHELGHSLVARRLGYRVRDITLYPIGGAARMESMPRRPWHEIAIALSGPAVNIGLAAALIPVILVVYPLGGVFPPITSVLGSLFVINLILAGFNLLPAFPMDGGRVLRGLLALRRDRFTATRQAAKVGRVLAAVMAVVGIVYPPLFMLLFIAVFVWLAGRAEEHAVERQAAWERYPPQEFPYPTFFVRRHPPY
ncbi:MAG: site-2 protease family protein [Planctomycetota bacterium]|jgi:Zn-dependent protease